MPYGKLVFLEMNKQNMNQAQLAKKIGHHASDISKIINENKLPSAKMNEKIAKALNIDIRKLNIEKDFDKSSEEIKQVVRIITRALIKGLYAMAEHNKKSFTTANENFEEILEQISNEPISDFIVSILDNNESIIKNTQKVGEMFQVEEIDKSGFSAILKFTEPFTTITCDNGMSPYIKENWHIKVQIKEEYSNGDIVCIYNDNKLIARRLIINGDYYTFYPINNDYEPKTFLKKDAENKIFAQAIAVIVPL